MSSSAEIEAELRERNAESLRYWRIRLYCGTTYPDAWCAVWRKRLDEWFEEQRDYSRRWMFKNRCAKRGKTRFHSV